MNESLWVRQILKHISAFQSSHFLSMTHFGIQLTPEMKYTNGIFQALEGKKERRGFQCQTCYKVNKYSSIKQVPSEMPAITTVRCAGALLGEKLEWT